MTTFQIIYLVLLLIGSGAAIAKDRWLLVSVLWINFGGTMSLAGEPMMVGILDLGCASMLLKFGNKREYVVAGLFAAMIGLYYFAETLGNYTTYTIVDGLAYAQIFVMGSGGFGELYRSVKRSLLALLTPSDGSVVGFGHNTDLRSQDDLDGDKKRGNAE